MRLVSFLQVRQIKKEEEEEEDIDVLNDETFGDGAIGQTLSLVL